MLELFDDLSQGQKKPRRKRSRSRSEHRRKKRVRTGIALFLACLVVVVAAVISIPFLKSLFSNDDVTDYPGPGTGEVIVTIPEGATGSTMAEILVQEDVVASTRAFVDAFNADPRSGSIQPGTYRLRSQMSGQDAVSALLDPASRAELSITIVEGFTKRQVAERLANVLEVDVAEIEAIMADAEAIGLPAEAEGDIEGWIAPLTYSFGIDATPTQVVSTMVAQRVSELERINLPRDQWHRTIVVASIVEREVNWADYYGQVARVIENRLVDNVEVNGRLQMDSTVLYGVGKVGGIPTAEDLADDNPYNTYIHPGLPPTPISNPSIEVIEASVNPPEGDWLYFVTVNLDTGETLFADNLSEHNANVQLLRDWYAENQGN